MKSAIKKTEELRAAIDTTERDSAVMAADIAKLDTAIRAAATKDTEKATMLLEQKATLERSLSLNKYKIEGLKQHIADLRADVLRERLDEARRIFNEKGMAAQKAAERHDAARAELEQATRDRDIVTGHWSNAGAIVAKLESELHGI